VSRAATTALPARPRRVPGRRRLLVRKLAPSRRSLAVGAGILVLAAGAYVVARETSLFAVDRIDVSGGSPRVDAQVRQALAPFLGKSLIGFDGAAALRRIEALPTVVGATYDRSFPNTLSVTIEPERPAAVLRSGASAWLVSLRGRIIAPLSSRADPQLPRTWLGAGAAKGVQIGEILPLATGGAVTRALGLAGGFRRHVSTASYAAGELVFHLRSGLELLLGAPTGVPLKVAVAARVLRLVPPGTRFVDVSVPGRPVSGTTISTTLSTQGSSGG